MAIETEKFIYDADPSDWSKPRGGRITGGYVRCKKCGHDWETSMGEEVGQINERLQAPHIDCPECSEHEAALTWSMAEKLRAASPL